MSPAELFESNLPLIERLLSAVCRRHVFPPDESEEFASWAKLRLIDDDYAVLRKWRGKSPIAAYLAMVIANLLRDYRSHVWGKWRPSAEARRLGTDAVQLETLVVRDGNRLGEAIRLLQTNFRVARSTADLEALAARLPVRTRRQWKTDQALAELTAPEDAGERIAEMERAALAERAGREVTAGLAGLSAEDRLALKLRFADGMAVVEMARMLGEPARPLYRRIERALGSLRRHLEANGLDAAEVTGLVGWSGLDLRLEFGGSSPGDLAEGRGAGALTGKTPAGPSTKKVKLL